MDLISVIVPVYKVEPYLDRCVKSVTEQTYRNLEIILVDDGSPDNCGCMCDAWAAKDSRIKVIHKENGGLSDARNAGLACVRGKYICFVDSDDIIDRHFVEWLHHAIAVNGTKMAACDIGCFDDGELVSDAAENCEFAVHTSEEALRQILQGEGVRAISWNKLYCATLLQGETFVYGKHHEDEFFTYRIVDKAEKVAYVNAKLYHYRQRPGSIMASFSIKRLDALEAYLERLTLLREKYPDLYRADKAAFCVSCVAFCKQALATPNADADSILRRINALRKKVSFSPAELRAYSMRERVYILGSRFCLRLLGRILNTFRGSVHE